MIKAAEPKNVLFVRPGFLIRRMHQIHLALFAEECSDFDVTPVQYSIMSVVEFQPDLDQAQLGFEVGIDRATMANVLARLEKKNYIARTSSPTDKRLKLVSMTLSGQALLQKMHSAAQRAHEKTIEALPLKERAQLLRLLAVLVDAQNSFGRAPLRLD